MEIGGVQIDEIRKGLLDCFDAGETFLQLGQTLKCISPFHFSILYEIDWKSTTLLPLAIYPLKPGSFPSAENISIPFAFHISSLFSQDWIELSNEGDLFPPASMNSWETTLPPLILFPLKVKQRILSAIAFYGFPCRERAILEKVSSFLKEVSPIIEKNILVEKTARKNQRLETILNFSMSHYLVINRAGIITDFLPGKENLLGFTPESLVGQDISSLFPRGKGVMKTIMNHADTGGRGVTVLITLANGEKELASVTVVKTILKYSQKREYFLLRIDPSDLTRKEIPGSGREEEERDGEILMKIHLCPENLNCIKMLGRRSRYMGKGLFLIHGPSFQEERCGEECTCLTELISVSNHTRAKFT